MKALRARAPGGGRVSGDEECAVDSFLPSHIDRFTVPGAYSLSRQILDRWLDGESDGFSPYVQALDTVDDVELDAEGKFKYTLMRATDAAGASKLIVRGSGRFAYHMNIFEDAQGRLAPLGVLLEPLGGGWVEKSKDLIYLTGISYAYGEADHSVSAEVIRRAYPLVDILVDGPASAPSPSSSPPPGV